MPHPRLPSARRAFRAAAALGLLAALAGCATTEQNVALGLTTATVLAANSPSSEIEQIFYLGVFDPLEQVPPQVYRVRVHGQGSAMSQTHFASGWVPAAVADSLSQNISVSSVAGTVSYGAETGSFIDTGRKMILFGPEGYREAPKDHRLVITMGANAHAYFDSINNALGDISGLRVERVNAELNNSVTQAMLELLRQRERLSRSQLDISATLPK